jgi:hypothetical protein
VLPLFYYRERILRKLQRPPTDKKGTLDRRRA